MTSDDLDMHIIRIRIKFWIDSYAYHVHLAIFPISDHKMIFFDFISNSFKFKSGKLKNQNEDVCVKLPQDSESVLGLAVLLGRKVTMKRLRSLKVIKGWVF